MRNRVVIASLLLTLLFGVGFALSSVLFAPRSAATGHTVRRVAPEEIEDAGGPSPVVVEVGEAVVVSIEGTVLRTDEAGELVAAQVGETVPVGGTLETEEGTATLTIADSTIRLFDRSEATIEGQVEGVSELRLASGRINASSSAESGGLRLRFGESDAVAELEDGELSAITDGAGSVAVASERGTVRLSAEGESVDIEEGEQSEVGPDQPPSAPRQVPSSFFLRVRRPPAETRERVASVTGRTTPGSVVRVNGERAAVDARGRFVARIDLQEGRNQVTIDAEDVRGRRDTSRHPIVVDSTASDIESSVHW